ncbi:unnamed protein product [Protopolystoma xenopodis]|uniref:Uncharacterized protein n=1 Tax=Protopolystoma xenopodis TaxID=117903 RepID=A0A448WZK6_9PLAT|nr:unnamed protein product [Protopolystoma xenopodis]
MFKNSPMECHDPCACHQICMSAKFLSWELLAFNTIQENSVASYSYSRDMPGSRTPDLFLTCRRSIYQAS